MASDLLYADDTPIRAVDRSLRDMGLGKDVRQGRIWAYVLDQRPWAGSSPPGAVYRLAPNWRAEHVLSHLADARGFLQADGYKCYAKLYAPEADVGSAGHGSCAFVCTRLMTIGQDRTITRAEKPAQAVRVSVPVQLACGWQRLRQEPRRR